MKRSLSNPDPNSPFKKSGTPVKRTDTPVRAPEDVQVLDCNLSPQEILEILTTSEGLYTGNIHSTPLLVAGRSSVTALLSDDALKLLDPTLLQAYIECIGLSRPEFYSHQVDAIESILVKKCVNVCISTSTSSGKSLSFNLPILSELALNPSTTTALYLYPTKALTQDQKRVIDSVLDRAADIDGRRNVCADILDGDITDMKVRREIMENSNLILTNPDMLHYYILGNSRKFREFFSKLKFVVIDESHVYNGSFGSHVSSVIRRLRRIIAHYNGSTTFISCSATIGNPAEHATRLVGVACDALVGVDGSPSGEKLLAVWDTKTMVEDVVGILHKMITRNVRVICFCKNRFMIELLLKLVVEKDAKIRDKIVAYRAGYSVEERRRLEDEIFTGKVLAVVCTTALELGMDIGALDVAISVGYPGSIHSLWQQWGRAGRGTRPSLSLLIAQEADIVDSYISRDCEQVLSLPVEDAVLQTDNPLIVKNHLISSDIELRFANWDEEPRRFWSDCKDESIFELAKKEAPFVKKNSFNIRNIDSRKILVKCTSLEGVETQIDELDITQAFFAVFPGAIHSVQGTEYKLMELNLKANVAIAVKSNRVDYYTRAIDSSEVIPRIPSTSSRNALHTSRGDVTLKIDSFWKIKKSNHEKYGSPEPLSLPAIKYVTNCVWFDLPDSSMSEMCVHGAMHALYSSACERLLLSRQSDLKCACKNRNRILLYDAQNGGLGISGMIYDRFDILVDAAISRVENCLCDNGCIRCLFISQCPNRDIDKSSTLKLLKLIKNHFSNP